MPSVSLVDIILHLDKDVMLVLYFNVLVLFLSIYSNNLAEFIHIHVL